MIICFGNNVPPYVDCAASCESSQLRPRAQLDKERQKCTHINERLKCDQEKILWESITDADKKPNKSLCASVCVCMCSVCPCLITLTHAMAIGGDYLPMAKGAGQTLLVVPSRSV